MLTKGKSIEFIGARYFDYVMPLGSGGTGDAHLFLDKLTNIQFAFKKYSPQNLD